jgi:hypothetical protein
VHYSFVAAAYSANFLPPSPAPEPAAGALLAGGLLAPRRFCRDRA